MQAKDTYSARSAIFDFQAARHCLQPACGVQQPQIEVPAALFKGNTIFLRFDVGKIEARYIFEVLNGMERTML